ncbi:hypothetical protein OO7_12349 [Providencia sneebia DSM 19967]|uniref:Phage tail protein C-terminal domain-containing protein n=2 Tax=Providencia sneebia TaxID=516075 RepID=K8WHP2_9GAMM|nr:hypothetical protein OO7_12349 [Providencia sneebia DSM 19967]
MSMKTMNLESGPHFVSRRNNGTYRTHLLQDASGTLMHLGDFGFGLGRGGYTPAGKISDYRVNSISYSQEANNGTDRYKKSNHHLLNVFGYTDSSYGYQLAFRAGAEDIGFRAINSNVIGEWRDFYTTANTTKDSNGNLKAASPIVKVFADHIENNDESEGVELRKLHTGIYQLHGVLGLNSDASWGGINGGITIPCGINQLPLVYVLYDVLEKGKQHPFDGRIVEADEDRDIVLYTTYRKHDLPQNIQYERFKLYPEFLKEVDGEKVELTSGEPCDIPDGHWVDVRVNMPSNSIYNQKLAESQRLAKIEAERIAKEEAEKAEQEAAEREQYELSESDALL